MLENRKKITVGRFAPTPSGFIHLGNAFCCLLAWLYAKSTGGRIILRIEDLDQQRCTRTYSDVLAEELEWLGLTWDEGAYIGIDSSNYFQSSRSDVYEHYLKDLQSRNLIYPCFCSRGELHSAQAPHASDGRVIYKGTCRMLTARQQSEKAALRLPAWRLKVDDKPIVFTDGHYGQQSFNLANEWGDFIVRRSDGIFAYQLAVAVDDALMGVTQVVRGCDLLSSTSAQLYIYELLGLTAPAFCHIPLLISNDGRRLSKRDSDLEISVLRRYFGTPEPIIGLLAYLAGQLTKPEAISAQELLLLFDIAKIPKENIIVPDDYLSIN